MRTVSVDFRRSLGVRPEAARRTLMGALEDQGFQITRAEGGIVEARRGPDVRRLLHVTTPVRTSILVVGENDGSTAHVHLAASTSVPGPAGALRTLYARTFADVVRRLDLTLPAGAGSPATDSAELIVREGGTDMSSVRLTGRGISAGLSPDEVHMCISVAAMAVMTPGCLPPNDTRFLEGFLVDLRRALDTQQPPQVSIAVDDGTRAVADLLYAQIAIRQGLPVRELHRCRDCRNEKIVNPDYSKLMKHNKHLRDWIGLFGVTVGSGGAVNVFMAAGKILDLRQLDPDFVCDRCQGMKAEVLLITLCPSCGTVCKDPILRRCDNAACGFDYGSLAGKALAWWPDAALTGAPPPPPPLP